MLTLECALSRARGHNETLSLLNKHHLFKKTVFNIVFGSFGDILEWQRAPKEDVMSWLLLPCCRLPTAKYAIVPSVRAGLLYTFGIFCLLLGITRFNVAHFHNLYSDVSEMNDSQQHCTNRTEIVQTIFGRMRFSSHHASMWLCPISSVGDRDLSKASVRPTATIHE